MSATTGSATDLAGLEVEVPEAPPIPGLRFRHWTGLADLPAMTAVCNAARREDGETEVATVETMAVDYGAMFNCDPDHDLLLAEVDGELVAYARVFWEDAGDGVRAYHGFGFVTPAWRRRGIGRAMLRRGERRNLAIASGHDTDRPRVLASWSRDACAGNTALLEDEGYVPVRRFVEMLRPTLDAIEVARLPVGLEVRPGRADQARAVHAADTEAFRDHWGSPDESETGYRRWRENPRWDPSLWVIGWDGDEVAGGVLLEIDPEENAHYGYARGWLASVFVRRPWRRRGLARALIGRALVVLRDQGMTAAQLGVDVDNAQRALDLYTAAGFGVTESGRAWRKAWPAANGAPERHPRSG